MDQSDISLCFIDNVIKAQIFINIFDRMTLFQQRIDIESYLTNVIKVEDLVIIKYYIY